MKINTITVHAGRTFNNPYESYSNLKPEVILTAALDEGEDAKEAVKTLQAQAEGLVEDHKNALLKNLDDIDRMTKRQAEVSSLEQSIKRSQASLDRLRKEAADSGLPLTLEAETAGGLEPVDAQWAS